MIEFPRSPIRIDPCPLKFYPTKLDVEEAGRNKSTSGKCNFSLEGFIIQEVINVAVLKVLSKDRIIFGPASKSLKGLSVEVLCVF